MTRFETLDLCRLFGFLPVGRNPNGGKFKFKLLSVHSLWAVALSIFNCALNGTFNANNNSAVLLSLSYGEYVVYICWIWGIYFGMSALMVYNMSKGPEVCRLLNAIYRGLRPAAAQQSPTVHALLKAFQVLIILQFVTFCFLTIPYYYQQEPAGIPLPQLPETTIRNWVLWITDCQVLVFTIFLYWFPARGLLNLMDVVETTFQGYNEVLLFEVLGNGGKRRLQKWIQRFVRLRKAQKCFESVNNVNLFFGMVLPIFAGASNLTSFYGNTVQMEVSSGVVIDAEDVRNVTNIVYFLMSTVLVCTLGQELSSKIRKVNTEWKLVLRRYLVEVSEVDSGGAAKIVEFDLNRIHFWATDWKWTVRPLNMFALDLKYLSTIATAGLGYAIFVLQMDAVQINHD